MTKRGNHVQQTITDALIALMEVGTPPWRCGWSKSTDTFTMPLRANGEAYRGINILLLWSSVMQHGFTSPYWFTYKQAQSINAQVKKGSKATKIIYYGVLKANDETEEDADELRRFARLYSVFNGDQIEGLAACYTVPPAPLEIFDNERSGYMDDFFYSIKATVKEEGEKAFYDRLKDSITLPPFDTFESANAFYSTLAHEFAHWTGAKDRLNRVKGKAFGDRAYAFEELVAELSAVFTMTELNAAIDLPNHSAYLAHWITAMREEPSFIMRAASAASASAEFLIGESKIRNAFCAA
ncbi:MAG: zincin-like metallopeptidase domain-containing protein [Pseudomonadota bacterium]